MSLDSGLIGPVGEGERDREWIPTQVDTQNEPPSPAPNFAPQGISTFQDRIRKKLPEPLDAEFPRRVGTIGKVCNAFSVRLEAAVIKPDRVRWANEIVIHTRLFSVLESVEVTMNGFWNSSAM